ncbi:MAG: hypothetical protein II496_06695, partial [Clostridiales bacterium]|nr:hypothetical protein [Clostridiales bacterium]
SDEELVDKITSGQAGVIAEEDLKTDQSANTDVKHTASVAADPAPSEDPPVTEAGYELGIDISQFQGTIDWAQVKAAGYSFAFIRCGGRGYGAAGNLYEDTQFVTNMKNAKAAGLKVGVYFFSQAITPYEALEEASLTIAMIKKSGVTPDYPVVMDWETDTYYRTWNLKGSEFANVITSYCSTISQNGYTPMVYLNTSDIDSRLGYTPSYALWYARPYNKYQDGHQYIAGEETPGRSWSVWQYSWWGIVPGISYPVDLNVSLLGKTALTDPVFNLKNGASELYSAVGNTSFDPLDGVTVTTSQSQTATSGITYTVKDAAGTETTVANAAAAAGTYTVTYSYKDSFKGTVTKTVNWTVTASSAQINLASDTISTTAGDAAPDPLAGVSVTASSGETITDVSSSVTYTVMDAAGNSIDTASAAATAGTYTITYSYTDTIYGTITKTAFWTVASVEQTVPSESETSAEAVPEST